MEITDICNMALSYLGKPAISSINEQNEAARQCKRYYDHCKRRLLRTYYFGFSKRSVALAEISFTHPRWTHVYAYPDRCLFVRKIFNEYTEAKPKTSINMGVDKKEKFEIFLVNGNVKAIGTDIDSAYCDYSYDVTDESVFSDDFIEALARMLAFAIAPALTGDNNIGTLQMQLADRALMQAKYNTAMEQADELEYPSTYADARN